MQTPVAPCTAEAADTDDLAVDRPIHDFGIIPKEHRANNDAVNLSV